MSSQEISPRKKAIVFVHPDLGIGGAERLVIDAATALQSRGYAVTILTSHCDPDHCFPEARDGEFLRVTATGRSHTWRLKRFAEAER